jgi:hypothetical protein
MGLQEPDLRQQQHAGIEIIDPKSSREGAALLIPGLLDQPRLHPVCRLVPVRGTLLQAEMRRQQF